MRWSLLFICLTCWLHAAPPTPGRSDRQEVSVPGVKLETYESPYYYVHTDLPPDDAREAVLRVTKMFEVYHTRTADLFTGRIDQKLSFYLFSKQEDYYAAGGMRPSVGVFDGTKLMATALRDEDGKISPQTWHVVQHEGFHQFVANVIRGQIPIWVNEGMAEYFGEGVFTGDGMTVGLIPASRLKRIQKAIKEGHVKTVKEMMFLSHDQWNAALSANNYDQAWSMVHFLAEGEDGKYRAAFTQFLQLVGRARQWDQAWLIAFGRSDGFEQKWKDYWLNLPDNPTLDLYAEADVSALTSILGRAFTQKQTFEDFDQFLKTDAKEMKAAPADWLPPSLFDQMKETTNQLRSLDASFDLVKANKSGPPRIVCSMPEGTKITGSFDYIGQRIGRVLVKSVKTKATIKKTD